MVEDLAGAITEEPAAAPLGSPADDVGGGKDNKDNKDKGKDADSEGDRQEDVASLLGEPAVISIEAESEKIVLATDEPTVAPTESPTDSPAMKPTAAVTFPIVLLVTRAPSESPTITTGAPVVPEALLTTETPTAQETMVSTDSADLADGFGVITVSPTHAETNGLPPGSSPGFVTAVIVPAEPEQSPYIIDAIPPSIAPVVPPAVDVAGDQKNDDKGNDDNKGGKNDEKAEDNKAGGDGNDEKDDEKDDEDEALDQKEGGQKNEGGDNDEDVDAVNLLAGREEDVTPSGVTPKETGAAKAIAAAKDAGISTSRASDGGTRRLRRTMFIRGSK
ncbi:expressed unknown protein [Seminavis robusta]|uniref:Uncharacterized protein n=1 Tax=Seminavis robusta TaxID=568900 RepID=A0A9N8HKR1_9STRA|nr:expressed unknown protein [Seminavis robusta]|eukprot:Sro965_g225590.1 n/a (333) ;mRNA; f:18362-19360